MEILLTTTPPLELACDLLAIACDEDTLAENAHVTSVDHALGGVLRRVIEEERFRAKPTQSLMIHTHGRIPASRVVLVGIGPRSTARSPHLRSFAARAVRAAGVFGGTVALLPCPAGDPAAAVQALAEGAVLGGYRFDKYLTGEKRNPRVVKKTHLLIGDAGNAPAAAKRGQRVAAAVSRARDLVNEPAGVLTPAKLAEVAQELAAKNDLNLAVLGPEECRAQGMGLFLAVAQGSTEEPRFIHLSWKPAAASKCIVLVGKGVTFDSGGLSLKPNDSMLDMKTDMAGAAAVLSVMEVVAQENLSVEVHALAACTENMPSGRAYKLGDVLHSKAGKTVEINNTDAEGRLTLADAITYGRELRPTAIIDFATLTGACMVALGPEIAGVMSNDETLSKEWMAAALTAGEEMWPLPLPDSLVDQLKSDVADMKNTGERWGGALTAGLFLKEFVGPTPWVHVDLAGPSTASKEAGHLAKGGTGFAVATIFEYLRRLGAA